MIKLTVFFDDPFWVGVFEKIEEGKFEICRIVFGKEPKDYEVFEFALKNFHKLKFSRPLLIEEKPKVKVNPKRMQRKIKKITQEKGVGTKAQQAIKLEHENKKIEEKSQYKKKQEIEEKQKFEKKQEKKKKKKRGH